jgi:hypothetical protein
MNKNNHHVDVGAPFLTRGLVCAFQFLLGIASAAFLRSECHGVHEHSLLSLFLRLPNLEGQVPVYISPRNTVAQLHPRTLGCFEEFIYVLDTRHFLLNIKRNRHTLIFLR